MRIDIITIFPGMFSPIINESILKIAQNKGLVKIFIHNLRDFSRDKHRKIDDRPFGGGPGMVFKPEPIFEAVKKIKSKSKIKNSKVILLSPQGKMFNQRYARKLSKARHLIIICGRYEGIDERVKKYLADEEASIGDYVLTGGELPAMVLIDAVARLIPGVLGDRNSAEMDSFSQDLLDCPHYTRPADFKGMKVPGVLTSGNHQDIARWRLEQSKKMTKAKRPGLIRN